jgi:hypothetical protein
MREFYKVTEFIKNHFESDEFVQTITHGAVVDLDINKKNIFPLVHMVVNSSQIVQGYVAFNFTIYVMDIRNISKKQNLDKFYKNDNELDILNTNFAIANRFITKLRIQQDDDNDIRLINDPTVEAITADFSNILDGWQFTIDLAIPNNISTC